MYVGSLEALQSFPGIALRPTTFASNAVLFQTELGLFKQRDRALEVEELLVFSPPHGD